MENCHFPLPPRLICLCGRARVGKSTCASMLEKRGFHRVAFADALKGVTARMFAPGESTITEEMKSRLCPIPVMRDCHDWQDGVVSYGRLLQLVGEGMRRALGAGVWISILYHTELQPRLLHGESVVIEDLRFPAELAFVRSLGAVVIKIERSSAALTDGRDPREEDITDTISADAILENDGSVGEMERSLDSMLTSLLR